MSDIIPQARTIMDVTAEQFRKEILPGNVPVLLKNAVGHWPAVQMCARSPDSAAEYIKRFDGGRPIETIHGTPEIAGKFFYNDELNGLNFSKRPECISATIDHILNSRGQKKPGSYYVQSASIAECLPGFENENRLDLLEARVPPRIWIGNRLTVQTHFDVNENIACCVAGRRRFTLFPPDQTPNLYPGPFEFTLAGPPVSMVRLETPDFATYPKFKTALQYAVRANLEPGDALYIPYLWWHHVQTLEDLNVLVNYWWNDFKIEQSSPFDALLHAILAIRDLPGHQRAAWDTMFDHYVFGKNGDPVGHLPPSARGALGAHDKTMRQKIRLILLSTLARQSGLRPPGSGK
jgi:hypothetical protein